MVHCLGRSCLWIEDKEIMRNNYFGGEKIQEPITKVSVASLYFQGKFLEMWLVSKALTLICYSVPISTSTLISNSNISVLDQNI